MKYIESDKDAIEAILYYQYRIDKALDILLKSHSKRSIWQKIWKTRAERELRIRESEPYKLYKSYKGARR
jgi:hypothetical protein